MRFLKILFIIIVISGFLNFLRIKLINFAKDFVSNDSNKIGRNIIYKGDTIKITSYDSKKHLFNLENGEKVSKEFIENLNQ
jgi:ribonuclease HIII